MGLLLAAIKQNFAHQKRLLLDLEFFNIPFWAGAGLELESAGCQANACSGEVRPNHATASGGVRVLGLRVIAPAAPRLISFTIGSGSRRADFW